MNINWCVIKALISSDLFGEYQSNSRLYIISIIPSLINQLSEYPIMMVVRVASFLLVLAVTTCQASNFLEKFFHIPRPPYAGEPHGTYSRSGPTYSSTSPAWPSPSSLHYSSSPRSLHYSTTTTSPSYSTTTPTPSPSSPSYSPTNPSLSTTDLQYLKYLKYLEYLKYLKY